MTGLCLSRRTVLCTCLALVQPGSNFAFHIEVIFLLHGSACLFLISLLCVSYFGYDLIQVIASGILSGFCELTPLPPLIPRDQRTASTATLACLETVSK